MQQPTQDEEPEDPDATLKTLFDQVFFWLTSPNPTCSSQALRARSQDPRLTQHDRNRASEHAKRAQTMEDEDKAALKAARPQSESSKKATLIYAMRVSVRHTDEEDKEYRIHFESPADAARFCGVHAQTIHRLVDTGTPTRKGYLVERWFDEPQDDLSSTENGVEEWKDVLKEIDGESKPRARVSSYGRAQTLCPPLLTTWSHKYTPGKGADEYATLMIDGKHNQMHQLVLQHFGPERPSPTHTPDHHNRWKGDNRLCNLKWEDPSGQIKNQTTHRQQSTSDPVEARLANDPTAPWQPFASQNEASKALGVNRADISLCLNPAKKRKSAKGYVFRRPDSYHAAQEDIDDDGENGPEEWAEYETGRLKISTYGRVQTKINGVWGSKRTVTPTSGHTYCAVMCAKGCTKLVHVLVVRLFEVGPCPSDAHTTVHHINSDPADNRLCNLMHATRSEQARWKNAATFKRDMAERAAAGLYPFDVERKKCLVR